MKQISQKNLLKLYINYGKGKENELEIIQVKDKMEAASKYLSIEKKVLKIKAAFFQNGIMDAISVRMYKTEIERLHKMNEELKNLEKTHKEPIRQ